MVALIRLGDEMERQDGATLRPAPEPLGAEMKSKGLETISKAREALGSGPIAKGFVAAVNVLGDTFQARADRNRLLIGQGSP